MVACVVPVVQQATGVTYLTIESRSDTSTCPYTLDDSTSAWHELGNMSIQNANVIGVGVGLVWAVAWGIKQIARSIHTDPPTEG